MKFKSGYFSSCVQLLFHLRPSIPLPQRGVGAFFSVCMRKQKLVHHSFPQVAFLGLPVQAKGKDLLLRAFIRKENKGAKRLWHGGRLS